MSHPVGRSAFAGAVHGVVFLCALAAVAAWVLQADRLGWRHGLGLVAVIACGAIALLAWLRSPVGVLRWDGAQWQWQAGQGEVAGSIDLALDLQSRLLLRFTGEEGAGHWLWLQRESDSADWEALRRAVYSRANGPTPTSSRKAKAGLSAGGPPAAEQ